MTKYLLLLVVGFSLCQAEPSFNDFDAYQYCLTKEVIQNRLERYLVKDRQVKQHYRLTSDSFCIYASAQDRARHKPEYVVALTSRKIIQNSQNQKKIVHKDKPLLGVRIALDPAFIGGEMAYIENRYVALGIKQIEQMIILGDMTLMLAKKVALLLEDQGAIVMLTREKVGENVYEKTFHEWLIAQKSAVSSVQAHTFLFKKIFNPYYELAARIDKINDFKPDISLVFSFNILSRKNPHNGLHIGCNENVSLAFVPGSFMKGELKSKQSRYDFLRLLLSDMLEDSKELSKAVLAQLISDKSLCLAQSKECKDGRLTSLAIEPGVWARNLALTRRVQSPVCYLLASCADNYQEAVRLEQSLYQSPSRLDELAEHCSKGVQAYVCALSGKRS